MATQGPVVPQADIPLVQSPMTSIETGGPTIEWYRFFTQLYKLAGGTTPLQQGAYLQAMPTGEIVIVQAATGEQIGSIQNTDVEGGPVEPLAVNANPFTFTADTSGFVVVFGAQVSISRQGGQFYPASLTGGSFPLRKADSIQLQWFGANAPSAEWFPD